MKNDLSKYKTGEELIEAIDSSLNQVIRLKFAPLDYYIKVLKELGFEHNLEDFQTNGWQVEFWAYFEGDCTLVLSGSLSHGNFKLQII
jgi:hypothetical protein